MEIQVLKKHGFSLRKIAEEVGCAVNTVRRHLAAAALPQYRRQAKRQSKLLAYEHYLRERQEAAKPAWIPATVLFREIVAQGYPGGISQLRAFLRTLKAVLPSEEAIRFETAPGEQMQVDWVEFRKGGAHPLYAFCATLGYSRASYVEYVSDMKVVTLIECHRHAFDYFGGVTKRVLYDNMKTIVLERDAHCPGEHRYHAGFLDYARHTGFLIKLCRPYRAQTKGKVERFNSYLRHSFHVPLVARLKQAGLMLDVASANREVRRWLAEIANQRLHATTLVKPADRLLDERSHLQALPPPWRGDVHAARPQAEADFAPPAERPVAVLERIEQPTPTQHPLAVYGALLERIQQEARA